MPTSGSFPIASGTSSSVFDPLKLLDFDRMQVAQTVKTLFGDSRIVSSIASDNSTQTLAEMLAAAQQMAGITRRQVTTDSYDLPVPGASLLSRLTYGADGMPGVAGADDDDAENDGDATGVDDPAELGWQNSDDWYAVMNRSVANAFDGSGQPTPHRRIRLVPDHPTIVDLLCISHSVRALEDRRRALHRARSCAAAAQYLLPPEVIAGKRMDLNRPFGDGRDNGDGIDNDKR